MAAALSAIALGFLYRLRGDERAPGGTQGARACWAVPFGTLLWFAATGGSAPLLLAAFILCAFAALIVTGHASHMVYEVGHLGDGEPGRWRTVDRQWTETASFWLPLVFGAYDQAWSYRHKVLYHLTGMAAVGVMRHAITALPLAFLSPPAYLIFVAFGLLHAPAYWLSWRGYDVTKHAKDGLFLAPGTTLGEFYIGLIHGAAVLPVMVVGMLMALGGMIY